MDATTKVTWRCAKGLREIDLRTVRTSGVTESALAARAEADDSDPVATLGEILVADSMLDIVYGRSDPDGYDATSDEFYVEILSAPRAELVGFARVSTAWTSTKPYLRRGQTLADIPEHRRARTASLGVAGRRALPPYHRDPATLATYERGLALLTEAGNR